MCGILIKGTSEFIYKTEMAISGQGGGVNQEIGTDIYIYKTNKDVLYSGGNYTQYSIMAYMGKESQYGYMYMHN